MYEDRAFDPPNAPGRLRGRGTWLVWSLAAIFCWGGWLLCSRLGVREIPAPQMQVLFTLGNLPVALALLIAGRFRVDRDGRGVLCGIGNGLLATVGSIAFYAAYASGGNTSIVSLTTALYPLVTVPLAVLLLRERLSLVQGIGLLCAAAAIAVFSAEDSAASGRLTAWFWFALLSLAAFGVVGLLQKLSTNRLSAESAMIWLVVGYLIPLPLLYPGSVLWGYSAQNLAWALAGGLLNAFGSWAMLAALRSGGKASIVVPLTALYPLVVVLVAPYVFQEPITAWQGLGIACSLVAVVLLSR
jgi:drug/metabolite transporter (DMT)-like permease